MDGQQPGLETQEVPPATCHFVRSESLGQLHEKVDRFWHLESGGIFEQEKDASLSDRKVLAKWKEEAV